MLRVNTRSFEFRTMSYLMQRQGKYSSFDAIANYVCKGEFNFMLRELINRHLNTLIDSGRVKAVNSNDTIKFALV